MLIHTLAVSSLVLREWRQQRREICEEVLRLFVYLFPNFYLTPSHFTSCKRWRTESLREIRQQRRTERGIVEEAEQAIDKTQGMRRQYCQYPSLCSGSSGPIISPLPRVSHYDSSRQAVNLAERRVQEDRRNGVPVICVHCGKQENPNIKTRLPFGEESMGPVCNNSNSKNGEKVLSDSSSKTSDRLQRRISF
ncbi:hypothetical protein ASPZODRAFT_141813 [Penicilliopsis zonata CBS 506.65]|uniref:Uncharacterized protein n=1 Tax=Penicilliopsis zonata CBS 506.65 TaxID=1073090 RepID=A0A1L9SIS8_9EURO|nr:hypothetical protein ASPZODRAFT_141813 [Penicilliopsis zonata CBS 506.65]OJJ47047.1 hypothetical protein ASPZODRAFT_141813 [Penicilliopsis zonata CBS 506.65]